MTACEAAEIKVQIARLSKMTVCQAAHIKVQRGRHKGQALRHPRQSCSWPDEKDTHPR